LTQKSKKRDNFDQQIAEEVEVGAHALAFFLFLAEIAESAEMAAFGLALLRSWYVSQKSRRGFSASGHTIKSEDLEYLAVINYEDLE